MLDDKSTWSGRPRSIAAWTASDFAIPRHLYDADASVHAAVNVRRRFQLGIRRDWASEMLLSD